MESKGSDLTGRYVYESVLCQTLAYTLWSKIPPVQLQKSLICSHSLQVGYIQYQFLRSTSLKSPIGRYGRRSSAGVNVGFLSGGTGVRSRSTACLWYWCVLAILMRTRLLSYRCIFTRAAVCFVVRTTGVSAMI